MEADVATREWWEHFWRSLDLTNPCCFNLEQICRRKRKRQPKKLNSPISKFFFFYFLLHFHLSLPSSHPFFTSAHANTHTHSCISSPLFCLLSFTAWGANECRGDQWRGNGGSPQLLFPWWFIKFAIVSIEAVQPSSLGKLLTALLQEVWQVHEKRVRG